MTRNTTSASTFSQILILIYVFFSSLWILVSHPLLQQISEDPVTLSTLHFYGNCMFVAISTSLIWVAIGQLRRAIATRDPMLQAIIEASKDAIFVKDLQGRYLFVNSTSEQVFGFNRAEILGKDDRELLRPEIAAQVMATDQRIMTTGVSEVLEEVIILNPTPRIYLSNKYPYRAANGEIMGLIGIAEDITERKCLERDREELLRETLNLTAQLQRETEDLATLNTITTNSLSTLELNDLLHLLLSRIVQVMHADKGVILLTEEQRLIVRASIGLPDTITTDYSLAIGEGFAGTIGATLEPFYIEDAQNHSLVLSPLLQEAGVRTLLGVPLKHDGSLIGVLHVDWLTVHPLSDREIHLLEITAERCAMAILNAQLYAQTKQMQETLALQIQNMPFGYLVLDPQFRFQAWNPAAERIFGYQYEEIAGQTPDVIVAPRARSHIREIFNRLLRGDHTAHSIHESITKNGQIIICEWHNIPLTNAAGEVYQILAMVQDVTLQLQMQRELLEGEERLRRVVENMPVMMSALDPHENIIVWNQECERVTGFESHEIVGNPTAMEQFYPDVTYRQQMQLNPSDRLTSFRNWEQCITCKDGSRKTVLWSNISPQFPIPGWASWAIGVDISDRKQAEETLKRYAFYDPLTGLPNSTLLLDRLGTKIAQIREIQTVGFAIFLFDIGRFQQVKYSYGHSIADRLLLAAARRLERYIPGVEMLAHIGADEFVILMENCQTLSAITEMAEQINAALTLPFDVGGYEVFCQANIGIALSHGMVNADLGAETRDLEWLRTTAIAYAQPEAMLRDADTALHQAKMQGRGRYVVFDSAMHAKAIARFQMETDLQRAIERQQFQVYYQPIVELATNNIAGFEALVRWQHPTKGMISPLEFIPLAEEIELIGDIDDWVLREACAQLSAWQKMFPGAASLTMSVNLSVISLGKVGVIERLDQILQECGMVGRSLKLEITESAIADHTTAEIGMLNQLKALGVQLSIDDFGTGYSSLGRLHQLPIDTLKIDRSFVNWMQNAESEIVRTIVTLARSMGIDAIAEGVETPQQYNLLQQLKCEYGQGYFFSKPVNAQTAATLLETGILPPNLTDLRE